MKLDSWKETNRYTSIPLWIDELPQVPEDLLVLKDYFRNKKAAIVGPSAHLLNKGCGHFIDSHDIVIRLNNVTVVPKEIEKDYGSKCDVIYTAQPLMRYTKSQEEKLKKVKYVFMTALRLAKAGLRTTPVQEDIDWLKKNNIDFDKSVPTDQSLWKQAFINGNIGIFTRHCQYMLMRFGYHPMTGLAAIHYLLGSPLESLYATGFSFSRENAIVVGKDNFNIFPHFPRTENTHIHAQKISLDDLIYQHQKGGLQANWNHNPAKDEKIFFTWAAKDKRIKLDPYLENLKKLNEIENANKQI